MLFVRIGLINKLLELNMEVPPSLKVFIGDIREVFPEASKLADRNHRNLGFEPEDEAFSIWLENFAKATDEYMNKDQAGEVLEHFSYFSSKVQTGAPEIKQLIDVSYVENLFWSATHSSIEKYWPKLPDNLRDLYIQFHGRALL